MMSSSSEHAGCCSPRPGRALQILYSVLLLWSREMHGLSDFSNYLFRIINSHSARARDGERALLSCPRHSTIAVHAAFYGQDGALTGNDISCSARTALQKMLSECQGHRHCQVLVHHHLFGRDPCPGTPKYLHVSYSCKPTEHKNRTRCEGDQMLLHCKYPKVLNIYWAVYGRELGEREACLAEEEQAPPYECLYHGALNAVRSVCYGKQRCLLAIDDQHFRNPCAPGTKKYLTIFYSCVPQSLLREADPDFFKTTSAPHETTKAGDFPHVRDSRLPENNGIILSSSLMAYGYIKDHAEMAGLLFVSGVCLGLLVILLAISVKLTCTRHLQGTGCLKKKQPEEPKIEDDDDDDDDTDDEEESEPLMDSSMMSDVGRTVYCWEEMTYTTEAAELMERLERREMVIQEIRMNAYLNGTSCTLH
ncbi:protein eva-1 homolog C [Colossoma macropomum]|uniref:protein eva-1 homolog C n=1 Tax=Colossoma macropomum TaxID=42526 RepID=UPI0018653087|nr:protein eva-1 homolog C [Colossoma macropomum]